MNVHQKCTSMFNQVWKKTAKYRKKFLWIGENSKLVTYGEEGFHTNLNWTIVSEKLTSLIINWKCRIYINTENNQVQKYGGLTPFFFFQLSLHFQQCQSWLKKSNSTLHWHLSLLLSMLKAQQQNSSTFLRKCSRCVISWFSLFNYILVCSALKMDKQKV